MQDTERPKFLVELLAEIDAFDADLFKPNLPVSKESQDTVIGTASPWLRKVYALGRYYSRQIRLIAVDREYENTDEDAATWRRI